MWPYKGDQRQEIFSNTGGSDVVANKHKKNSSSQGRTDAVEHKAMIKYDKK